MRAHPTNYNTTHLHTVSNKDMHMRRLARCSGALHEGKQDSGLER